MGVHGENYLKNLSQNGNCDLINLALKPIGKRHF